MTPGTAVQPKIFISYSSTDSAFATATANALAVIGFEPWIDKNEIRPGDSFLERMGEGLQSASYIVLLISAASSASRWVRREWMSGLAKAGTVILPILLDDSEVPQLLKDIVYIDARRDQAKAISEVVAFCKREISTPESPLLRTANGAPEHPLKALTRRQLRLIASGCMEAAQLQSFCFDAEVDVSALQGNSIQEKIVSLLHTVASDGLEQKFARWLELERSLCVTKRLTELRAKPGWDWPA